MKFSDKLAIYKQRQAPVKSLVTSGVDLPSGNSPREILEKLLEIRRQGSLPTESLPSASEKRGIAICFVIVDELYHEELWRKWLETGSDSCCYEAEIFIHAKYPDRIESRWARERLIPKSFHPEWNSTEVVRAMLELLSTALSANSGIHRRFLFATESCIPITSLVECGNSLFSNEKSWVNAYNTPESVWEDVHCFKAVNRDIIPPRAVCKSIPGWILLTRKHAEEIIALVSKFGGWDANDFSAVSDNKIDLVSAFGPGGTWEEGKGGVFAPEEVFFPTMLCLLGYIQPDNPSKEEIVRKSAIFAKWRRKGDANPIQYSYLDQNLMNQFRENRALFARKFPKDSISVEIWLSLILSSADRIANVPNTNDSSDSQPLKKQKTAI